MGLLCEPKPVEGQHLQYIPDYEAVVSSLSVFVTPWNETLPTYDPFSQVMAFLRAKEVKYPVFHKEKNKQK